MGLETRFVVDVPNLIEQSLAIFFRCYHGIPDPVRSGPTALPRCHPKKTKRSA